MDNKDQIKDLFADKLGQMEMPVRPDLWSAVSSQIGGSTVAGSSATGLSLISKIIIGVSVVAASTVTGIYLYNVKAEDQAIQPKEELQISTASSSSNDLSKELQTPGLVPSNKQKDQQITPNQVQQIPIIEFIPPTIVEDVTNEHDFNIQSPGGLQSSKSTKEEQSHSHDSNIGSGVVSTPEVEVNDPVVEQFEAKDEKSTISLKLPNVFTPNGDGENDEFLIESNDLTDFNIVVLDQMNKVVYQSNDSQFRWDGTTLGGDTVAEGYYVYYLTAIDAEGKKVTKYSTLQVKKSR